MRKKLSTHTPYGNEYASIRMRSWLMRMIGVLVLFTGAAVSALTDISIRPDGYSVPALRADSVLNTSLGARSYGMAEAQTGRSDDLSSLYYNPAGLSLMNYWEYGLTHSDIGLDVGANSFMLSAPLPYGSLGVSFSLFNVRNNYQIKQGENVHPDRSKYAYIAQLSYGFPVYKKIIHTGLTVKYSQSEFSAAPEASPPFYTAYPKRERGIYFDWGLLARYDISELGGFWYWFPKVSWGLSVRNMQPKFGLNNEAGGISPQVNTGVSFYYSYSIMLNIDAVNEVDKPTEFHLGAELWPIYFLALRGGYLLTDTPLKGLYWGLGLGESIGSSKFSFEYSGNVRTADEFRHLSETYHRFAFHQSFERVFRFVDSRGRKRQIKLAQTDRYNTPLQFARIIQPDEIIDEAAELAKYQVDNTLDDETKKDQNRPTQPTEPQEPEQPGETTGGETKPPVKRPPPIVRKKVGIYPFVVQPKKDIPALTNLRKEVVRAVIANAKLMPMREIRYKLTPRKESNEDRIAYLNRLCRFHRADLIIFAYAFYNETDDTVNLKIQFYKKGDKTISGLIEKTITIDLIDRKAPELKKEIMLQIAGILDVEYQS